MDPRTHTHPSRHIFGCESSNQTADPKENTIRLSPLSKSTKKGWVGQLTAHERVRVYILVSRSLPGVTDALIW